MALTYGTNGIKQKDYQVYIAATATAATTLGSYKSAKNLTTLGNLTDAMTQLGELRTDSISITAENGDTVEGNNVGEIVLNKACAMAAELINATPTNINALSLMDGTAVTVVVVEKDFHKVDEADYKTVIVIENLVMSYSENITGGDIPRASISISRSVANVADFRIIDDVTAA